MKSHKTLSSLRSGPTHCLHSEYQQYPAIEIKIQNLFVPATNPMDILKWTCIVLVESRARGATARWQSLRTIWQMLPMFYKFANLGGGAFSSLHRSRFRKRVLSTSICFEALFNMYKMCARSNRSKLFSFRMSATKMVTTMKQSVGYKISDSGEM